MDEILTGSELMLKEMDEQVRERYRLTWANLDDDTRARYLRELDDAVKAAVENFKSNAAVKFAALNSIKT